MEKLHYSPGSNAEKTDSLPSESSEKPTTPPSQLSKHQLLATGYTKTMFRLCQIPEAILDQRAFLVAVAAVLAEYPETVMIEVAKQVPSRFSRPSLADVRAACDAAYAPIAREAARQRTLLPPAPRPATAEDKAKVQAILDSFKKHMARGALIDELGDRYEPGCLDGEE